MGLESALAKIYRANKHIIELDEAIKSFFKSEPYKILAKRDQKTREVIYYIGSVDSVPDEIPAIAGDVVQNLRSALDHLAYQLVFTHAKGHGIADSRARFVNVAFHIYDNVQQYESAREDGKIKGMSQDATDAIDHIKPYRGGNELLWQLRKLNNIDKHRLLIAVGSGSNGLNIGRILLGHMRQEWGREVPSVFRGFAVPSGGGVVFCPLKSGDVLFTDIPNAEINEDLDFGFEVAFHEGGIIENTSLLKTLKEMSDLVGSIVPIFRSLVM